MEKKQELTVEAINGIMDRLESREYVGMWNDQEITLNVTIGFGDMIKLVNEVVNSCFGEDGTYNPEAKDFAFRLNLIELYTNILLPEDIEAQYAAVYGTDLIPFVLRYVNHNQIDAIREAIDRKIQNRAQANIEAIMKYVIETSSALDNVRSQMADQFSSLFGDVSAEDLAQMIKNMAEGGIDEKKIVEAYLAQAAAGRGRKRKA